MPSKGDRFSLAALLEADFAGTDNPEWSDVAHAQTTNAQLIPDW